MYGCIERAGDGQEHGERRNIGFDIHGVYAVRRNDVELVRVAVDVELAGFGEQRAAVGEVGREVPAVCRYFTIRGRTGDAGSGAAGETANVSHTFQPSGRCAALNSP